MYKAEARHNKDMSFLIDFNGQKLIIDAKGQEGISPTRALKEISVFIDLKGVKLDTRREKALLDFVHNCPVQNTLTGLPEIKVNLTDGN